MGKLADETFEKLRAAKLPEGLVNCHKTLYNDNGPSIDEICRRGMESLKRDTTLIQYAIEIENEEEK